MIYATTSDANSVMISVIGKKNMKCPIKLFQNAKGMKGASVVIVPENTGINTSPAAILAALAIGTAPLLKIRCVFSITTMASSTTIPKAKRNENNTIIFNVKPIAGIIRKAMKHESGTDKATNIALVLPIKNIRMMVTSMKPIMMVFIKSFRVDLVLSDWSPVTVISNPLGKIVAFFCLISSFFVA